jgi:hypothetical protein
VKALRLPAQVLEDPTLVGVDESSADSAVQVWFEIGSISLLKPRMVEKKLSSTYNCT